MCLSGRALDLPLRCGACGRVPIQAFSQPLASLPLRPSPLACSFVVKRSFLSALPTSTRCADGHGDSFEIRDRILAIIPADAAAGSTGGEFMVRETATPAAQSHHHVQIVDGRVSPTMARGSGRIVLPIGAPLARLPRPSLYSRRNLERAVGKSGPRSRRPASGRLRLRARRHGGLRRRHPQ